MENASGIKKYVIVGTGGTGGPIGAYLAKAGKESGIILSNPIMEFSPCS